jgi:hypothetical protein
MVVFHKTQRIIDKPNKCQFLEEYSTSFSSSSGIAMLGDP